MAYTLADVAESPSVSSDKKTYTIVDVHPDQVGDQSGIFRQALQAVASKIPFLPPVLQATIFPETAKAYGRGALRGATFGSAGSTGMEGSVMEPHPVARKAGELTGVLAPLLAAEATGGASLGLGAEAVGSDLIGQGVLRGAGTGMIFEGMKGAATNRSPGETVSEAAKTGLEFAGFGAAGGALGYLRSALGNNLSEWLQNHFLNTESKIAMKLREQGRPSVGKSVLETTDLAGNKNRNQVYDMAKEELGFTENRINVRLPDAKGEIPTADVANSLDEVSSLFNTGTHEAQVAKVEKIKESFLKKHPESLSIQDAMDLKRKLDNRVNKAYLAESGAKLSVETEIDEALANSLRAKIYELDPVLGDLAAKESLMLKVRTGLSPKVAESGGDLKFYRFMNDVVFGNRGANIVSGGLKKVFGQPSRVIAPATRLGSRIFATQQEQ